MTFIQLSEDANMWWCSV